MPVHAGLGHQDFRCFVGCEKNVVVRGVEVLRKLVGCQRAAQMVAAAGGHMDGSPDFFVLDVAS